MSNIICTKTNNNNWLVEKASVTIQLVQISGSNLGINYSASYSGIKDGNINGGPYPIAGNGSLIVNQSPEVTLTVSKYSNNGKYASMNIKIVVATGIIGTVTVFNDKLEGNIPQSLTWAEVVEHLATLPQPE